MITLKLFLKALIALPELLSGLTQLIAWLERKFGPDWEKRITELTEARKLWETAQTPEEEENAVKAMARALNSRA